MKNNFSCSNSCFPPSDSPCHSSKNCMTSDTGKPISNDTNSITVGANGPVLLEDVHLISKLAHFDRERIPERVVHAKGTGAFGYFQNYRSLKQYTKADFLQHSDQITKVFVRFSTVIGSKGSPDTARDPRGFAVKFYTNEGVYDIVGNHIPVFFIRDALKFPDLIHSLKPDPVSNQKVPCRFWDFISKTPESTHMLSWLYSDLGTIKDYRHIDGFGVNTYLWINENGQKKYVKYHWKTMQGVEMLTRKEAQKLAGEKPDIASELLAQSIRKRNFPRYELCVQLMEPEKITSLDFDPLDDTKIWPEEQFPLYKIGMMTLNQNPDNFFAQVEQAAFCPANLIPGIGLSADKMLQGRSFAYHDTQRYRIGSNFLQLPVNRSLSPIRNNQQDGSMSYYYSSQSTNYNPSNYSERIVPCAEPDKNPTYFQGYAKPSSIPKEENFRQAQMHYESLSETQKNHLAENIAVELCLCPFEIQNKVLSNIHCASDEWAEKIIAAMKKI